MNFIIVIKYTKFKKTHRGNSTLENTVIFIHDARKFIARLFPKVIFDFFIFVKTHAAEIQNISKFCIISRF